jgi:hypothetical protein
MKKNLLPIILLSFLLAAASLVDGVAQSGVYVGGHIRRERPATITKLKASGFQTVILFNVHVEPDGSLTTDGDTICRNGHYVFAKKHPYYIADIRSLKTPPTSIERIEICIGGWGNTSYENIKQLFNANGLGENTALYENFRVLKDSLPEIDAVNNDDEHAYDVRSAVAFHLMMDDLGYKTTLAPYTRKTYWTGLIDGINQVRTGVVERVLIQCYDGGAGNNPSDWHIAGIPLHAGRLNYQDFAETQTVMNDWKTSKNVTGGFFWVYNDESWNLNKYATTVNRIFGTPKSTDTPAATFYDDVQYGGYAVALLEGAFHTADMAAYGLTDNEASSIQIHPDYEVTVYDSDNFKGKSYTFDADVATMQRVGNNQTSSIVIARKTVDALPSIDASAGKLRLYPNPAQTDLYVETAVPVRFYLSDLLGKIHRSGNLPAGNTQVNIKSLPKGLYLFHAQGMLPHKIIKE